ncbi:MAG TPA: transcription elongation factor GreA [Clostridia bacterium]|nr:transcription elongation factor GreA [Clostridia bacterium]
MARERNILTHEGYAKLLEELEHLKTTGRDNIAEKIKEARSFGDLSENAEYDEAMNEQAKMEARIAKLEEEITNADILDENDISTEVVSTGSKVKVRNISTDDVMEYKILSKTQADPAKGIISDQSPVGRALAGRKTGEIVAVETPNGNSFELEILSISR